MSWHLITDYGTERCGSDWDEAWRALPKRKDGWPDRRKRNYLPFLMYEDLIAMVARDEWIGFNKDDDMGMKKKGKGGKGKKGC